MTSTTLGLVCILLLGIIGMTVAVITPIEKPRSGHRWGRLLNSLWLGAALKIIVAHELYKSGYEGAFVGVSLLTSSVICLIIRQEVLSEMRLRFLGGLTGAMAILIMFAT